MKKRRCFVKKCRGVVRHLCGGPCKCPACCTHAMIPHRPKECPSRRKP
jgi:hypothetical protein